MEKPDLSLTLGNTFLFNAVQLIKQRQKARFTKDPYPLTSINTFPIAYRFILSVVEKKLRRDLFSLFSCLVVKSLN